MVVFDPCHFSDLVLNYTLKYAANHNTSESLLLQYSTFKFSQPSTLDPHDLCLCMIIESSTQMIRGVHGFANVKKRDVGSGTRIAQRIDF